MNKSRKPLTSAARKKNQKETKKGQKILSEPAELPRTDTLTPAAALKKLPAKRKKVEKPLIEAVVKGMEIKKKKKAAKVSKRTTPDEVDFHESPRAYAHQEGARWEKTVVKQNIGSGKALTAKLQKRAARAPAKKKK